MYCTYLFVCLSGFLAGLFVYLFVVVFLFVLFVCLFFVIDCFVLFCFVFYPCSYCLWSYVMTIITNYHVENNNVDFIPMVLTTTTTVTMVNFVIIMMVITTIIIMVMIIVISLVLRGNVQTRDEIMSSLTRVLVQFLQNPFKICFLCRSKRVLIF